MRRPARTSITPIRMPATREPGMLPNPPQRHDHVGQEPEQAPHVGEDVEEAGQEGPRHAHAGGADPPAQGEHPLRVDAHEGRRLAVLRRRLQRRPRLGLGDEPDEHDPKAASEARLATSCGSPTETPKSRMGPWTIGSATWRKSGVHRNCAVARRKIPKPKVAKICASMGAERMRRMIPLWVRTPRPNRTAPQMGTLRRGSRANRAYIQKAVYIPSIRNSPWGEVHDLHSARRSGRGPRR